MTKSSINWYDMECALGTSVSTFKHSEELKRGSRVLTVGEVYDILLSVYTDMFSGGKKALDWGADCNLRDADKKAQLKQKNELKEAIRKRLSYESLWVGDMFRFSPVADDLAYAVLRFKPTDGNNGSVYYLGGDDVRFCIEYMFKWTRVISEMVRELSLDDDPKHIITKEDAANYFTAIMGIKFIRLMSITVSQTTFGETQHTYMYEFQMPSSPKWATGVFICSYADEIGYVFSQIIDSVDKIRNMLSNCDKYSKYDTNRNM